MKYKNEEIFHYILRITVLVAVISSIALLITKRDAGPTVAFDLLAYIISFTALILATLQSITISRQMRITRNAAAKITEALHSLDDLVKADAKLSKVINHDARLDEKIIAALAEHGIGENEEQRTKIARSVRRAANKK